ncbi:MAG TPA: vWA domain-containing protein [Polyangia bacterium]|jgi:hypothetical protein
MRLVGLAACAGWLVVVVGCGDSGGGAIRDGGGGDVPGDPGDAGGGACTTAAECGGAVCDPATHTCTTVVPCTGHAECGLAAHCGADGTCAPSVTGSPCAADGNCTSGESCTGGFCGCGGQSYAASKVPPNVLIVLDRSSSMNDAIAGGTKWSVAKAAIADLLAAHGGEIRFGLALYPGQDQTCATGQSCGAGAVFVDPGDATAVSSINTFLGGAHTCSFGTPTAEELTALESYAGLEDAGRANYILLITDGQSTCNDPIPVVTALQSQTPAVKTFVVGFGSSVDPVELNGMAQEGGTAIAGGPPYYYVAGDAASLGAAFATIAGSVLSCSYTLSGVPPDLDKLYIYENQQPISRDTAHAGGWDYDAATNQVTFFGAACQALQSGQVTDLTIVYGCPIDIG